MNTVVSVENVSKKYSLGVTRSSILRIFTKSAKNLVVRNGKAQKSDQVLWALKDVSFELKRGESLALIGKNGAGKSTALKLLAKITRPTSGEIKVNGRLSALIELGSGFHGDLTGRENIFLNGAVLGMKRKEIKKRFDEIVDFSEIESFIDTPVKRYSSGMLVRLGFAVAACIEPEILLVDEVLAVGDAAFREKSLLRIKKLLDQGTSLIFVSHNINMIDAVCSFALYLKKGQIVDRGDVKSVISAYEKELHDERAKKYDENAIGQTGQIVSEARIEKIEVLRTDNNQDSNFSGTDGLEIRVSYSSTRNLERADAAIRIIRSDGLTCSMVRTSVDGYPLSLNQGGGSFSVTLEPNQLIGGKYFVDVHLNTSQDLVLLDSKRSDWFFVRGDALSFEEKSGVFVPFRKWSQDISSIF